MRDFLENFEWHSSLGIDGNVSEKKNFKKRFANTKKARSMFLCAGENFLIHKATNALWRISEDKKSIVPVFDTDVLSEEDLGSSEEEG